MLSCALLAKRGVGPSPASICVPAAERYRRGAGPLHSGSSPRICGEASVKPFQAGSVKGGFRDPG